MKVTRLAILPLVLSSFSLPASAALMFNFDYVDVNTSSGVGFDHSTLGTARQAAFEDAAADLGAYFNHSVTIDIEVRASQTDGTGFLASAGTGFSGFNNTFIQGDAQRQILSPVANSTNHGFVTWDFGRNFDLDDSISASAFDFKSIATHELLHVLGFVSAIQDGGVSFFGAEVDAWTSYDQFLVDGDGNRLINNGAVKNFNSSELADITGGTGTSPATSNTGVYFDGANAVAANGGNLVPIYSPTSFEAGSSLSHVDTEFFGLNTMISSHAIGTGQGIRELSAIELGIFADLGYSVTAVPVPPAIWLLGSGLLALLRYRRIN